MKIWQILIKELADGELDWEDDSVEFTLSAIGAHIMSRAYESSKAKRDAKISDSDMTFELEE